MRRLAACVRVVVCALALSSAGIACPVAQTARSLGFRFVFSVADEQQVRFAQGESSQVLAPRSLEWLARSMKVTHARYL